MMVHQYYCFWSKETSQIEGTQPSIKKNLLPQGKTIKTMTLGKYNHTKNCLNLPLQIFLPIRRQYVITILSLAGSQNSKSLHFVTQNMYDAYYQTDSLQSRPTNWNCAIWHSHIFPTQITFSTNNIYGWEVATQSWNLLPYFRPKYTIFHTLIQTWLSKYMLSQYCRLQVLNRALEQYEPASLTQKLQGQKWKSLYLTYNRMGYLWWVAN